MVKLRRAHPSQTGPEALHDTGREVSVEEVLCRRGGNGDKTMNVMLTRVQLSPSPPPGHKPGA